MKVLKLFAILALVVLGLSHTAKAGLIATIDIGNDGSVEGTTSDLSSPFLVNTSASSGSITVLLTSLAQESAAMTSINTTQAAVQITGTGSGTVRIKVLFEDLALPTGDPLKLTSTMSSSTPNGGVASGSNATYVDDNITLNTTTGAATFANAAIPVTATIGTSPTGSINATGLRDRFGSLYDLLSDITINYNLTTASGHVASAIADSLVEAPVPEASSLVAWGLCAAVGAIVAYRRRRTA